MELILTDAEYYDLFKALRFAIEHYPERSSMLDRMVTLYKTSPEVCQFVITARETNSPATVVTESEVTA